MSTITVKGDAKSATQELNKFRKMLYGAERQMPGSIRNLKSEILVDHNCENNDECSSSEQITLRRIHHRSDNNGYKSKETNLKELLAKCLSSDSDDNESYSESEDIDYSFTDDSESDLESESESTESESESESTKSESEYSESESDSDSDSNADDPCERLNKLLGIDSCSDSEYDSESEPGHSLRIRTDSEQESESDSCDEDPLFNLKLEVESDIDSMFGVAESSSTSCSENAFDSESSLDSDSCSYGGNGLKHLGHGGEDEIEIVIHRYHRYH